MSEHFQPKEFASKDGKPSPYPLVVQQGSMTFWKASGEIR